MNSSAIPLINQSHISFHGLTKAMYLLSAFGHCYAPLYKFTQYEFMKDYVPVLGFVQGLIYQTDAVMEDAQASKNSDPATAAMKNKGAILTEFLTHLNLYTPQVEEGLEVLARYYKLENEIMIEGNITHDMIVKALDIRSSDFHLLHHITRAMAGLPYHVAEFEALKAIEAIAELEMDFSEYPADIATQDYNTYRMFVKLYQHEAKAKMQAEHDRRVQVYQEKLSHLSTAQQAIFQEMENRAYEIYPPVSVPDPILES